ncbi:hypothetical protein [Thalassoglobus sp.]|uniref:hypothetical protein n=1 Tax=Thalassoglobus sp. TaxID=2795869 RepID=UPI003AA856AC
MVEFLDILFEKLEDHWVKIVTAAIFMFVGWLFGKRRAAKNWEKREFFDRLNVSLNIIRDGNLKIRTLNETRCELLFPNSQAAQAVIEAAKKTTLEDPILPLPEKDYWYYLNAVLNEISEQFATGALRSDLGLPVSCDQFVICLTSEADGNIRMRKVRAMVIRKSLLENLPKECPKLARKQHSTRWGTLQKLAAAYKTTPERFMVVELCQ